MPDPAAAFDFQTDVVAASHGVPVLVDFWAPWCGPCLALGPTLDRLAAEAAGRWRLVKVNTDEHPELMTAFGVRGIPAVKLFAEGAVVADFTGALPEPAVRQWLAEHLPSPARAHAEAGRAAWAAGRRDDAAAAWEAALAAEPDAPWAGEARDTVARHVVFAEPARARALVADRFTTEAEAVRAVARLLQRDPEALPGGAAREAFARALRHLRGGALAEALAAFTDALVADRGYDDDGARRAAVALFQVLGEDHAASQAARPAFNRSLF